VRGEGRAPPVGVYHGHVANAAAVVQEVVGQLVGGLVDLAVGEDAQGGRGGEGLDDACSLGELGGVGGEYLVDGCTASIRGQNGRAVLPPR
jgi:hypothetical protein